MAGATVGFTPTGGSLATLGDDANKIATHIESIGGQSIDQVEPLDGAAAAVQFARGNVQGEFVFTAGKSHADRATAVNYFKAQFGKLNQKGSLVYTVDSATLTMAGAVLRAVTVADIVGLRWTIRYAFGITTVT